MTLLNIKGISAIAGIIAVIVFVAIMPVKPGDIPPPIKDVSNVVDDATMQKDSSVKDSPDITETTLTNNNPELDYYIDEKGTKHFILDVRDVPSLEG